MNKIYGETKQKLLEIRKECFDKEIKCYILTKDFNIYAITKVSKKNVYYEENGEEIMLEESILDIYESPNEVAIKAHQMIPYYENKIKNLYTTLSKIIDIEKEYRKYMFEKEK